MDQVSEKNCPRCQRVVHRESWICPHCQALLRYKYLQRSIAVLQFLLTLVGVVVVAIIALIAAGGNSLYEKWRRWRRPDQVSESLTPEARPAPELALPGKVILQVYRSPERMERAASLCYRLIFAYDKAEEAKAVAMVGNAIKAIMTQDLVFFSLQRMGRLDPELLTQLDNHGIHHEETYRYDNTELWPIKLLVRRIERIYADGLLRFNSSQAFVTYLELLKSCEWEDQGLSLFAFKNKFTPIFGKINYAKLTELESSLIGELPETDWLSGPSNYELTRVMATPEVTDWVKDNLHDLYLYGNLYFSRIFRQGHLIVYTSLIYPEVMEDLIRTSVADTGFELQLGSGFEELHQRDSGEQPKGGD